MVPESERVVERHELGRDANCMVFELAVRKIFIFWKVWRSTLAPVSQSISKKYRKKNPNFFVENFYVEKLVLSGMGKAFRFPQNSVFHFPFSAENLRNGKSKACPSLG